MARTTNDKAQFERQYDAAVRRGKERLAAGPLAARASYHPHKRSVIVALANGFELTCPVDRLQGLRGAPVDKLSDIEVAAGGLELHWKQLDVQFTVPGLLEGILGTKRWMSELGRTGGIARSKAKAAAARKNGRKGGRPRKALLAAAKRALPKKRRARATRPLASRSGS